MHFFFLFLFADRSQTLVDYTYHVQRFAFQEAKCVASCKPILIVMLIISLVLFLSPNTFS